MKVLASLAIIVTLLTIGCGDSSTPTDTLDTGTASVPTIAHTPVSTATPTHSASISVTPTPGNSSLYVGTPTIAGPGETIVFPDQNLESIVRNAINKPTGDILATDLVGITSLTLQGVKDITGLEYCNGLVQLDVNEWLEGGLDFYDEGSLLGCQTPVYLNSITDIHPLVINPGIGHGDIIDLRGNTLNQLSLLIYIPQLEERGVEVKADKYSLPVSAFDFNYIPFSTAWILENDANDSLAMIKITFPTSWFTNHKRVEDIDDSMMLPVEMLEPYDIDDDPDTFTIEQSATWFYSYSKRL